MPRLPTQQKIENEMEQKNTMLAQADRCVKCGLCSAQCPTYLLDGSENESPRGRIALAQALAQGQLDDITQAEEHINNCLTCQRCEKVCPSGVEFGRIIANSRALLAQSQQPKYTNVINWASKRTHNDWQKITKITRLAKNAGILRLFPSLIPIYQKIAAKKPLKQQTPVISGKASRKVSLFTGCISHVLDTENIENAQQLLTLCGYTVSIPESQICCGALPKHKGLLDTAKQCEKHNEAVFCDKEASLVFLATACGAALKDYGNIAAQAQNITTFLNNEDALANITFKPSQKRVLIHEPCSEKNALREIGQTQKILANIPGISIISLKETTGCCGAAGDYMITHAEKANEIRKPLIDDINAVAPDIIVTTNYTCGIHIQNGFKSTGQDKGLDIPVIHPIKLLLDHIESSH